MSTLYKVDTQLGSVMEIATAAKRSILFPCWSPNGTVIAFSEIESTSDSLIKEHRDPLTYEHNLVDGKTCCLASGWIPAYSPDGKFVSLVRGSPSAGMYIVIINRKNSKVAELRSHRKQDILPHACLWSPDSRSVCFFASGVAYEGLYVWTLTHNKWLLKRCPIRGAVQFSVPRWLDSKRLDFFRYGKEWGSVEAVRWNLAENRARTLWKIRCHSSWISFVPRTLNAWMLGIEGKHLVLWQYDATLRQLRILSRFPAPETENVSVDWCIDGTKASLVVDDRLVVLDRAGHTQQNIEAAGL